MWSERAEKASRATDHTHRVGDAYECRACGSRWPTRRYAHWPIRCGVTPPNVEQHGIRRWANRLRIQRWGWEVTPPTSAPAFQRWFGWTLQIGPLLIKVGPRR